jgi:leucyl aminopeptidase (aminopeptidase T)
MKIPERLRKVARKVLDNALPIQPDETAFFYAGIENLNLAYAFAAECESRGIETMVQSNGDYIANTRLLESPIKTFTRSPRITPKIIETVDWFIYMTGTSFDNSILQRPEHAERVLQVRKNSKWSLDNMLQLCLKNHTHLVVFLDPNLQQAKALNKTYSQTQNLFLNSLDIDYESLSKLGQRIIHAMENGGEIHMTCPQGSDLKLRTNGRPWMNEDGKQHSQENSTTRYVHNLPVGEVFVAPLEDSAYGVAYPKQLPGSLLSGVRVEFNGKEKATISAEKGFEFLKARLEKATGNPYCIAEFAFGTNPCSNMLLTTEKAFGTCHFAIGQNTWLGGKNECSIHLDFLIDKPTVKIDQKVIVKNGRFLI